MRLTAALGALCFLASLLTAAAQVRVSAQTERSDFLLYERVDLLVTLENAGESDLVLTNDAHPWLSFLVSKKDHLPVRPERQASFKPINLKVGERKTLRVNLTPLFSFREEGSYLATAVVDLPGANQAVSGEVPFTVLRGRQIWTERRPVEGSQRTYSLLRFSPSPDSTELYLRVEDPSVNTVYANVGLGHIAAFVDPEIFFDPQSNIHVLHTLSSGTYLYSRADSAGKIVHQGVFKVSQKIAPHLRKLEDGNVIVVGGLESKPEEARESLSTGQKSIPSDAQSGQKPAAVGTPEK